MTALSENDKQEILQLRREGWGFHEISLAFPRTRKTLANFCKRHGIKNPYGNLTQIQKQEIAELREQGWQFPIIAKAFKISISCAKYHADSLGAIPPWGLQKRSAKTNGEGLTIDDKNIIAEGIKNEKSKAEIAKGLNKPYITIYNHIIRSALQDLAIDEGLPAGI